MELNAIERGTGHRVVFVHGDVFGAELTWAGQLPLAEDRRLVMVNRRGFGASPDTEAEDFELDARDVAEIIADGAHLVGHSYGGVVSLLAAAARPEAVDSLTVIEPPALDLTVHHDEETQVFISRIKDLLAKHPDPEAFLRDFIVAAGGDPSRLPTPLPPPLLKAASIQMKGRWPWDAKIPLDQLAKTHFPKMVVSGGHSHLFDAVCDILETRLHAQRVVLRGAGHSIPTLGEPLNQALRDLWARAESLPPGGATTESE